MTRTAKGLVLAWMNLFHFDGWASFWNVLYIRPGYEWDYGLIRHETKHLEQMRRDGKLIYLVKYLWWWASRGYLNNPYEVEARAAQHGRDR